jgi:hypothetical protein
MIDETAMLMIILALYSVTGAGMIGIWKGISRLDDKIVELSTRLAVIEATFRLHCGEQHDNQYRG